MHVISKPVLREFWRRHSRAEGPLSAWWKVASEANWKTTHDILSDLPSTDFVGNNRAVFDIAGNRYRLVARLNLKSGTLFIRFVGTHADYDRIDARTI